MENVALKFHNSLVTLRSVERISFLTTAELLYRLKFSDSYKEAVGSGADTWRDYLAQPEINLTVTEANKLVDIYKTFVRDHGFKKSELALVPVRHLEYLLAHAKTASRKEVEKLLADAENLSFTDLKARFYDVKTKEKGTRTYQYVVMKKCVEDGTMVKVHGTESEVIQEKLGLQP